MTKSTFVKVNERSRHFFRGMLKMTNNKWILVGAIAILYVAWLALPLSRTAAQPQEEEDDTSGIVLVAGPLRIKGIITSDDVVPRGERAVLMVTNITNRPINVRLGIRDAAHFSTVLATIERTLQPGEGASLPYIERTDLHRSVVGLVIGGIDGESPGQGHGRLLASLSVVDDATGTTRFAIGPTTLSAIAPNT